MNIIFAASLVHSPSVDEEIIVLADLEFIAEDSNYRLQPVYDKGRVTYD